ncbi:hypothetical protein D3C72_1144860 [compost metagenome]
MVASLDGVVDGGHGPAVRFVPARGREVQPREFAGPLARQLRTQEVGKEAVVAPRAHLAAGIAAHGREEQVGGGQLLEDDGAVAARVERLAHRGVELAQDAGAQQEVVDLGRLVREHVFGQVVGHGAVGAREAFDEAGLDAVPLQRHRRQPDGRHPAFGLAVQLREQVGRQRLRRLRGGVRRMRLAQADEGAGFFQREAQAVGVDLDELAACTQPAQPEVGQAARADHDLSAPRQVLHQLAHEAQHGGLLHHFEVVQEERERRVVRGQRGHGVEGRVACGLVHADALHGLGQAVEKARHVVVGAVEREPGGGDALRVHALADLRHGGGLAKARGRAHQHELDEVRGAHGVADRRALDLERRQQRWTQLGGQRSGASAGGRRHALSGLLDTCHWRFVVFRAAPPLRQCEGQCEGQCEAMRPPAQQRGRA